MKTANELNFEAAMKFYEVTRSALVSRVILRDNSIMFYIAGIAALAGATVQSKELIFLMIIPIVSLGVAGIVAHHNKIILGYILYLTQELQPKFTELGITAVQWDLSHSGITNKNVGMRYFSDVAYIAVPSLLAVFLNLKAGLLLQIIAIICVILSTIILARSYNFHRSVDKKLSESNNMLKDEE